MTDQEKLVAIAEACGWEYLPGDEPTYGGNYKQAIWYHPDKGSHKTDWRKKGTYGLPDYLNNLNAMADAEKTLAHNQFHAVNYPHEVFKVVTGFEWKGDMGYFFPTVIRATARQRAEAFLRTIGKWKDS